MPTPAGQRIARWRDRNDCPRRTATDSAECNALAQETRHLLHFFAQKNVFQEIAEGD